MKRMSWITLMVISLMLTVLVGCGSDDDGSDGGTGSLGSGAQTSVYFDHYNPDAWHGRGVAMVMCWGEPTKLSCDINGIPMTMHGATDKGRDVWTIYNSKGLSGTITCTAKDGSMTAYNVSAGSPQFGNCSNK